MKTTRHSSEPGMLLDIASYARRGPGHRDRLSSDEIALIRRTVTRTPEVMVKVLTHGGKNLSAIHAHVAYLNRQGDLEVETDMGERLAGEGAEKRLLADWDLDLQEHRRRTQMRPRRDRTPPKLVHKILFSMPPGTPPLKVLVAVKRFAREEFGARHRYAMVLHTDEPHPHVHMVVKAVSEQGERLNIRKATLRRWRVDFAEQLRVLGVAANATERAVRGVNQPRWRDAIYRADLRNGSSVIRGKEVSLQRENRVRETGRPTLLRTRQDVEGGWLAVAELLNMNGTGEIAQRVLRFVEQMPRPRTDLEWLGERARDRARERAPMTR
jgi:relaxase-like protein